MRTLTQKLCQIIRKMNGAKYRGCDLSLSVGTGQHTGVGVCICATLCSFLPQVITINDSVLLVNQPGYIRIRGIRRK